MIHLVMKPQRPCLHPGCPALVSSGRCEKHKQQNRRQTDEQRGTAAERGYDGRWQKERLGFLMRHPLCAECERQSKLTAATVVDHVKAHKGNKQLFWDSSNWQPLCKRCHDIKTAKEDGRWGGGM